MQKNTKNKNKIAGVFVVSELFASAITKKLNADTFNVKSPFLANHSGNAYTENNSSAQPINPNFSIQPII